MKPESGDFYKLINVHGQMHIVTALANGTVTINSRFICTLHEADVTAVQEMVHRANGIRNIPED